MPIFVNHGDKDRVVAKEFAFETYEKIPKHGREFITNVEPGLEHTIGEEGLLLLRKYFDKFTGRKPLEGL